MVIANAMGWGLEKELAEFVTKLCSTSFEGWSDYEMNVLVPKIHSKWIDYITSGEIDKEFRDSSPELIGQEATFFLYSVLVPSLIIFGELT